MAARKLDFKIPLQTEIQVYIKEKKGWPESFCIYYAERFWNFYASNGWKVSGKTAMKNWQAAFNANWQNLKFKEDIDMLQRCGGKPAQASVIHIETRKPVQNEIPVPKTELEQLEQVLAWYKETPAKWSIDALMKWPHLEECYLAIKQNRLWNPSITKGDVAIIKQQNPDENYFKASILVRTFEWYGKTGYTFSDNLKVRNL